jgi:hypothetical protein
MANYVTIIDLAHDKSMKVAQAVKLIAMVLYGELVYSALLASSSSIALASSMIIIAEICFLC